MHANDFDEALRRRFSAQEPEAYDIAAWDALVKRMPATKAVPRMYLRWLTGLAIAACLAMICILIIRPVADRRPVSSHAGGASSAMPAVPGNRHPAIPVASAALHFKRRSSDKRAAILSHVPARHGMLTPVNVAGRIVDATSAVSEPGDSAVTQPRSAMPGIRGAAPDMSPEEQRHDPKTVISLAGGVQYGSLNAGYAAAIHTYRRLSRHWYVAAEVGYLSNRSSGTEQVSRDGYDMLRNYGGTGLVPGGKSPELVPHPTLEYLTASPYIGYQITGALTTGAGIDVQRVLKQPGYEAVQIDKDDIRLLPATDFGVTMRLSYRLSKRLEAGIVYRQGVNNVLRSSQEYLDRQYVQVQLKLPLIKR